ncbi:MAG: hypothetical protein HYY86_01985 [Candidatus Harrisonbacteria bacterium]|nr:hypothetical protein [Candidatus Harrisonbacteria bacterium]
MRNIWIIIGLTVLALTIAGLFYWWNRPAPVKTTEEAIEVLSESPATEVIPTNPLENKVPDLNPVEKTNPFKDSYKNPFAP